MIAILLRGPRDLQRHPRPADQVQVGTRQPTADAPRFGLSDAGVALLVVLAVVLIVAARTNAATPAALPAPLAVHTSAPATPHPPAAAQPFPGTVPASTRQVVSVTAPRLSSRTATLRLWQRDRSGQWQRIGGPVRASLGSGGLTRVASDARPQTPLGSWAMDVVLARDPGITAMREHVLRPGDGWSSCTTCADYDRLARSGEMWAGRNTWARVAIHVVTNPHRVPGHSSGVFVHVGDGYATSGCVGVPLRTALRIARWLQPSAAPRLVVSLSAALSR